MVGVAGVAPTTRANQARVFLLNYTPSKLVPMAGFPPALTRLEDGRLMFSATWGNGPVARIDSGSRPRPYGPRLRRAGRASALPHLVATIEMVSQDGLAPSSQASRACILLLDD